MLRQACGVPLQSLPNHVTQAPLLPALMASHVKELGFRELRVRMLLGSCHEVLNTLQEMLHHL